MHLVGGLPFYHAIGDSNLRGYGEESVASYQVSTGALSPMDAVAFADFVRSRHAWLRDSKGRIPVWILTDSVVVENANDAANH